MFGTWLKTTPQVEIKAILAEAIYEEFVHAEYLSEALKSKGAVPYDYKPVPAQMAMFNGFEALTDTCERIAAFPFAGEGVADYLIGKSLKAGTVPEWVTGPYQKIHADEEEHGNYPFDSARQICHHCRDPGPRRAGRGDEPHAPAPVLPTTSTAGFTRIAGRKRAAEAKTSFPTSTRGLWIVGLRFANPTYVAEGALPVAVTARVARTAAAPGGCVRARRH